jgi:hypothetical protein
MNACYYARCPLCGATAIETTMDKLRNELTLHMNTEHPVTLESPELLSTAMNEAGYYPGSQVPKAPTATQEPGPSPTGRATQVPQATTISYACPQPGCQFVSTDTDLYRLRVRAIEHLFNEHVGGANVRAKLDLIEAFNTYATQNHRCSEENLREPTPKPPLGIEPEYIWRETRMFDLIACIARYQTAGFPVKDDWLIELERYLSNRCAPKYAGSKRGFGQPPVPFHDGDTPLGAE